MSLHAEVLCACGYALFLLAVARGLVALGRRARDQDGSWPRSDVARFHQGLSTTLVSLAGLLAGTCALHHPASLDLGLLGLVSLAVAWMARLHWREWWAEPSARAERGPGELPRGPLAVGVSRHDPQSDVPQGGGDGGQAAAGRGGAGTRPGADSRPPA